MSAYFTPFHLLPREPDVTRYFNRIHSLLIPFLMCLVLTATSACTSSTTEKQRKVASDVKTLGEAYFQQGNYTAALKEFLDAEKVIPDDPYLHNDLGLVYMARNRFDLAEKHFLKAVTLDKDFIPAKNNLGASYLRQEKWSEAISCYNEIADNLLYATPHYAQTNLGWAYLGKGDIRKAKESFSKALKLRPDFINATHGLATAYLMSGQTIIAEHLLEKAISNDPSVVIFHADLAKVYEETNQLDKARLSWQTVIKLAPGGALAEEAQQRLDLLN